MQRYLGMYDISCNQLRTRVFKLLLAFGIHQQKSVFECHLDHAQKHQLIEQLSTLTEQQDKRIILIKIYPQHPQTMMFGQAKRIPQSNCLYIG